MSEPITAKEYHDQIRSICQSAYEEFLEDTMEREPDEWFNEWLHRTIDGHQWIIYTWRNIQVLTHTDNHEAYWESEYEGDGKMRDSFGETMAIIAYCAMAADVQAHMDMSALGEVAP